MSITIERPAQAASEPSRTRRLVTAAAAILASAGLVLSGAGVANAASYTKAGSTSHLTLSGPGITHISGDLYELDVSINGGAGVTVEGADFETGSAAPNTPAYIPPVYYTPYGATAPVKAGVYAVLGRAALLPSDSGSTSASRTASTSVWIHDGDLDYVEAGSEFAWADFTDGEFEVEVPIDVQFVGGLPQLYDSRNDVWFNAFEDDNVFQLYTTSSLGTQYADNEWVVNVRIVP